MSGATFGPRGGVAGGLGAISRALSPVSTRTPTLSSGGAIEGEGKTNPLITSSPLPVRTTFMPPTTVTVVPVPPKYPGTSPTVFTSVTGTRATTMATPTGLRLPTGGKTGLPPRGLPGISTRPPGEDKTSPLPEVTPTRNTGVKLYNGGGGGGGGGGGSSGGSSGGAGGGAAMEPGEELPDLVEASPASPAAPTTKRPSMVLIAALIGGAYLLFRDAD